MNNLLPQIVLLGRPNVGKSTLFNRLVRSARAITHDRPGITRDRMTGTVYLDGQPSFILVDTGGLNLDDGNCAEEGPMALRGFEQDILEQAEEALKTATVVVLVVDAKTGLLPMDARLADYLRKKDLPTVCAVNKVDSPEQEERLLPEFYALGLELLPLSAAHGFNLQNFCEHMLALLPQQPCVVESSQPLLRLALLGRPNAGKSSLLNALVGSKRMIVSEQAGTTRDSVNVEVAINDQKYLFVDTAGVRRRTKITDTVEKFSVSSALKSSATADLTLFVLDATEGLSAQDKRLLALLHDRCRPCIILINKSDLLTPAQIKALLSDLAENLNFCAYLPRLAVSAVSGFGLKNILPLALKINAESQKRISTGQLNRAMETVLNRNRPAESGQRRIKFFYLTQAETSPPTFVFFVNDATLVPEHYVRYLERSLRKLFALQYTPLKIELRSSHKSATERANKGGRYA